MYLPVGQERPRGVVEWRPATAKERAAPAECSVKRTHRGGKVILKMYIDGQWRTPSASQVIRCAGKGAAARKAARKAREHAGEPGVTLDTAPPGMMQAPGPGAPGAGFPWKPVLLIGGGAVLLYFLFGRKRAEARATVVTGERA